MIIREKIYSSVRASDRNTSYLKLDIPIDIRLKLDALKLITGRPLKDITYDILVAALDEIDISKLVEEHKQMRENGNVSR